MLAEDSITTYVQTHGGVTVLAASGAVDMATSPQFRAAIVEALADDPAALVIDLLGVEFFGSAGVSVLVDTRDGVASDMRFGVVAAGPVTGRVLQLLKLEEFLSVHETLEAALTAINAT